MKDEVEMQVYGDINEWADYEIEKQKLVKENLTPEEYSKRIKAICKKLGV